MKTVALFAFAGLAASSAMGQVAITPNGTNSGNGFYRVQPATSLTSDPTSTNQTFTATGSSGTDHMFLQGWSFRGNTDGREYSFATGSNTSTAALTTTSGLVGGTLSVTRTATIGGNTGSTATAGYDYAVTQNSTNAGNPGYSFTSQQRWTIFSDVLGPRVIATNTVTNTGTAAMSLRIFWNGDIDWQPTFGNDFLRFQGGVGAPLGGPGFFINDAAGSGFVSWATAQANISALQDLRWRGQIGSTTTLIGSGSVMANGIIDDLVYNNTPAVNAPANALGADVAYGFQWILNLQPGESAILTTGLNLVPTPSALALMGMGGLIAARRRRA